MYWNTDFSGKFNSYCLNFILITCLSQFQLTTTFSVLYTCRPDKSRIFFAKKQTKGKKYDCIRGTRIDNNTTKKVKRLGKSGRKVRFLDVAGGYKK